MSNSTKGLWVGSANEYGAGKALLAILLAGVMMFTFGGLFATAGGPPESGMGINQFYVENGADRVAFEPVRLHLDATGATHMQFSNNGATWSDWEQYASTKYPWLLDAEKGSKTVHARIKKTTGGDYAFAQTYVQYWNDRVPVFSSAGNAVDINPRIAVHPEDANTLCVVWEREGAVHRVLLSCSTDNGVTWNTPSFVSMAGQDARNPDIVIGGQPFLVFVHIVWQQYDIGQGKWQIYHSRWTTTVQSLPPIDITPPIGGSKEHPRIALGLFMGMSPFLHVVYEEGGSDIMYMRNDFGGMGFWSFPQDISLSTPVGHPAIAVLDNFVHVVFESGAPTANIAYVQNQEYGEPVPTGWSMDHIFSLSPYDQKRPDVAASGSVVHVVWDEPDPGFERIRYTRNPTNGVNPLDWLNPPIILSLPTNSPPTSASVSPTIDASSGIVAVAWQGNDEDHWELYFARHYVYGDPAEPWERWSRVTFAGYHARDSLAPALALGIQSPPQVNVVWQNEVGYVWEIAYKNDRTERGEPPPYDPIDDLAIEIVLDEGPSDVYASTYQDENVMEVGTYAPVDPKGEVWNRHVLTEGLDAGDYRLRAIYHLTIPHAEGHEDGSGTEYRLYLCADKSGTDTYNVKYGYRRNTVDLPTTITINSASACYYHDFPTDWFGHHGDLWIKIEDVDTLDTVQDTLTIWSDEFEDIDGAIWLYAWFPGGSAKTDLKLTWTPSMDDPILDRYDIYMANGYHDSYFIKVGSVPTGNPTPEFRLKGGAIAGSPEVFVWETITLRYPRDAYFTVVGRDSEGRTVRPVIETVGKFTIDLPAEWVLLSLPMITPSTSTPEVFAPIDGHWERVLWYDASTDTWKEYNVDNPLKRDLLNVDRTMGLWLELTSDLSGYLNTGDFTVVGDIPATTQIPLHWSGSDTPNLVGYPYLTVEYHDPFGPETVQDALSGVCYVSVETYDPYDPPYYLELLSNTDFMYMGLGYWVTVSCMDTWDLVNIFPTESLI